MGHNQSKAKQLNNPQLLSFFVLLSIDFQVSEVHAYLLPLQVDGNQLERNQEILQRLRLDVVPNYHQDGRQKEYPRRKEILSPTYLVYLRIFSLCPGYFNLQNQVPNTNTGNQHEKLD